MNCRYIGSIVVAATALASEWDWNLPKGFPPPPVPSDNPMSAPKVELGRHLFYDKRMSVNRKQSCASCHRQDLAFSDGRARAEGTTGQLHPRSSMSLVNAAYAPALTWAHPALNSLEEQALVPMLGEHPVELGLKGNEDEFLNVLRTDPLYQRLFAKAFSGPDPVNLPNVARAIAAFERSIVSMRSPYDRYRWGGDPGAISDAAKRGELLFSSSERAGCFQCHGGWNFSSVRVRGSEPSSMEDQAPFFNTGVSAYAAPNRGIHEHTKRSEDLGRFRAPTLRNIEVTAPYMHDGSIPTLEAVIDHYASGGTHSHVNKTRILRPFQLTQADKRDLIEFLKSLTDREMMRDPRWSDPWANLAP
ncbi:MAG TPA: MbnH family di-heme enzyme [Bryobacteraceae bacterium]|nr:MbnH family di-heme enzyme [Bryobacteraceae bacterium]